MTASFGKTSASSGIKPWRGSLMLLAAFGLLVFAGASRANRCAGYVYIFAYAKVYSGPYQTNLDATYFSQVVKVSARWFRHHRVVCKEKAKEQVESLIQQSESVKVVFVRYEPTYSQAASWRTKDIDDVRATTAVVGRNEVGYFRLHP